MEVFDLTRGTTTGTIRVPALAGTTVQFKIRSTKTKKVNGKADTTERIGFTYSYANQAVVRASWVVDPSESELYIVTLSVIYTNTSTSENRTTVPFTQEESGNVLNLTVIQEGKKDYTFSAYPLTLNFPKEGGTQTIEVESYALYSDGSKVALVPYVDSKPTWLDIEISPKNQVIGNTKYSVKVTASINPTSEPRRGYLVLNQGVVEGKELTFNVFQGISITEQDVTLTLQFPTIYNNGSGAFFAENESPNNTSAGAYYNFSFVDNKATFTYKPSVGIMVNLSTPGSTKYVKSGDKVKVYTIESGRWIYLGIFTMTSGDQKVLLTSGNENNIL